MSTPATISFPLKRDLGLVAHQVGYAQRSFWRNRRAAFFSLIFPLMFLIVFGSLSSDQHIDTRANLKFIDFYVPGIITYAIVLTGFNSSALMFATLREKGILKRLRSTPLPWPVYVAGFAGSTLVVILASVIIMLAVGIGALGAHFELHTLPALIVTIAIGAVMATTLGIAAARIVNKPESGMGILTLITLPIMFVSNVFFPIDSAPKGVREIADALPIRPLADSIAKCFDPRTTGAGFDGDHLKTLIIWGVVGTVLMLRYMRSLNKQD